MGQEVGAYADPSGDRNRAIDVIACAFRRPGQNGGRGCGTRHGRFGSRRSRGKYRVVFGLRETDVCRIRNDRGFKHLLCHHRIRSLLLHRICCFEQGLYEAKKAINMPTCCTANHHQLDPHTKISYSARPPARLRRRYRFGR